MGVHHCWGEALKVIETARRLRPYVDGSRKRVDSHARFGVVWALRQRKLSYPRAAQAVGFKDHTSAIHAERVAVRLRREDAEFRAYTDLLMGEDGNEREAIS